MNAQPTARERVDHWAHEAEIDPDSARAHFNLGLAHTETGHVNDAERAYLRALELDPDLVEAWVNLGGVRLLKWDFTGCLEATGEAVARRDDLAIAHFNMGQAHLYLNDPEALVACNRRTLAIDPRHAAAHYFLAVGLLATGHVMEARVELNQAMRLNHQPSTDFLKALERAEAEASPSVPVLEIGNSDREPGSHGHSKEE